MLRKLSAILIFVFYDPDMFFFFLTTFTELLEFILKVSRPQLYRSV